MEAIMVAISEINLRSIILLQQIFFKVRIIIRLISFANLPSAISVAVSVVIRIPIVT